MRAMLALLAPVIALATPAIARDLAVPANKGWQHAGSRVILRSTLVGLPRTSLADAGNAEWDVSAQFEDTGAANSATVYVFHPAAMNVALWFDRARTAIEQRDTFGGITPLSTPVAFTAPRASTASALRQVFATGKGPYRSTGLAVVPVGEWLVVVRLSSKTLDPAALDTRLTDAVAAVGWPVEEKAAPVAVPIAACPTQLTFAKAKQRKPDMEQMVLGSFLSVLAAKKTPTAPAPQETLCRDGKATMMWGMYRAPDATDNYLVALGDSGRTVSVYKSFVSADLPSGYPVALHDLDGSTASYPWFDKLPAPQQVVDAVLKGRPTSRTQVGGNTVTINAVGR